MRKQDRFSNNTESMEVTEMNIKNVIYDKRIIWISLMTFTANLFNNYNNPIRICLPLDNPDVYNNLFW